MASGKQTPRQKMINLMYLVFIAMLALNMSKEVLTAFGTINTKLERANVNFEEKNSLALADLSKKANENEDFKTAATTAASANKLSNDYFAYLDTQKAGLLSTVDDPKDFEKMDQSNYLDELYYKGGKLTEDGQKFLSEMDKYREGMVGLIGNSNKELAEEIKTVFSTGDITVGEGTDAVTQDYISYNYIGFPSVSALTKMTQIQNDVKVIENELLSKLLSGNLQELASISNYETVMTTSKGAYYTGETFDGKLSLGRVDASTKPSRVELLLDGRPIGNKYEFDGGRLALKVNTGGVGDHTITGSLFYPQDGKEIEVKVEQKFTTINKPNSATIAADKMNVVYRGVTNPMTISFAGVADNQVSASATGLTRKSGSSYEMRPGQGNEIKINVSAKLPDGGGTVTDSKTFRIKGIPRPVGTIRGEDGSVKMQRNGLEIASIGAILPDFDFELRLNVTGFKFKVPGQPTVQVNSSKLDARAKSALRQARRGETVQIFDINAKIAGNSSYKLPKISPVIIELTN